MHNHIIAGDFGYLPVYTQETGYVHGSQAIEGLKEYVNSIVDSVEDTRWRPYSEVINPPKFDTVEDYWKATGVVTYTEGADERDGVALVHFDRKLASIDYAEISLCWDAGCKVSV